MYVQNFTPGVNFMITIFRNFRQVSAKMAILLKTNVMITFMPQ
jgi:hypothetical protein